MALAVFEAYGACYQLIAGTIQKASFVHVLLRKIRMAVKIPFQVTLSPLSMSRFGNIQNSTAIKLLSTRFMN